MLKLGLQQLTVMGNTHQQIQKQLKFVQRLEDLNFGPVDLFKSSDGIYIMKMDRQHVKGDLNQTNFKRILQYVQSKQNKYVVPLIHTTTKEQHGFCLAYECTSVYTEYYNHTLGDMLKNKKIFEEAQLWLILESMLTLIVQLKENKLAAHMSLKTIFLTLKGIPCISHNHLYSTQNSLNCYEADMSQLLAKILIELIVEKSIPEGQVLTDSLLVTQCLGKVCSKFKLLGKLTKQLLKRQKTEKEILDQIENNLFQNKIKKASEIKLTKYKYIIPDANIQTVQQFTNILPKNNNADHSSTKRESKAKQMIQNLTKHNQSQKKESPVERKPSRSVITQKGKQTKKEVVQVKEFGLSKGHSVFGKEESSKMLSDLQNRKLDYQIQMEKFRMRKEELLCNTQKENNLDISRPHLAETQPKKVKGKILMEATKKKKTEPTSHYKLR